MQTRAKNNPKIEFIYNHTISKAIGDGKLLKGLELESVIDKLASTEIRQHRHAALVALWMKLPHRHSNRATLSSMLKYSKMP